MPQCKFYAKIDRACTVTIVFFVNPKGLFCVFYAANFPDDIDFDLSGIFELVFEFLSNLLCKEHGVCVVDLLGFDHNSDFSAGLDCESLFDAVK